MDKSAEVLTNDPKEPVVQLMVKGPVDKFATINPRMLNLRGNVGEALEGTVVIVPDEKYPFKVVSVAGQGGQAYPDCPERNQGGRESRLCARREEPQDGGRLLFRHRGPENRQQAPAGARRAGLHLPAVAAAGREESQLT